MPRMNESKLTAFLYVVIAIVWLFVAVRRFGRGDLEIALYNGFLFVISFGIAIYKFIPNPSRNVNVALWSFTGVIVGMLAWTVVHFHS